MFFQTHALSAKQGVGIWS